MGGLRAAVIFALAVAGCRGAEARRTADSAAHLADSIGIARSDSIARARQDSINRAQPGYIVDSILPLEEELRRFRADIEEAPTRLSSGAESRDQLVRRFVRALEKGDTASLRSLAISRAEYAYLVYPSSPYTKPPYRQSPRLAWMLLERESEAGFTRLLRRVAGKPFGFVDYTCSRPPQRQSRNRLWHECVLRLTNANGEATRARMFGTIIERDGRWKLMSFANDF